MIIPVIIVGIAVVLIISGLTAERRKTTTGVDHTEILAKEGATLLVEINMPAPGTTVSSNPVIVGGVVHNSIGSVVSGARIEIAVNGTKEARVTTQPAGLFSCEVELETPGLNEIKVYANEGEIRGSAEVTCDYQPAPAGQ